MDLHQPASTNPFSSSATAAQHSGELRPDAHRLSLLSIWVPSLGSLASLGYSVRLLVKVREMDWCAKDWGAQVFFWIGCVVFAAVLAVIALLFTFLARKKIPRSVFIVGILPMIGLAAWGVAFFATGS